MSTKSAPPADLPLDVQPLQPDQEDDEDTDGTAPPAGIDGIVEGEEEEEEELDEDEVEGEGYESSSSPSTQGSNVTWITWFCSLPGHEYFCEVAEDFIEDDFNLTGLNNLVPFYKEAMEMVLDVEADEESHRVPDVSIVESSAELLYGLIHQRYIITRQGLQQMYAKYDAGHFGVCPRVYCTSNKLVPCGRSDLAGVETVKLYCPSCVDQYVPPSSRFLSIDGAFFGTTFPHLMFQTYASALPFLPANTPAPSSPTRKSTTPLTSLAKVYVPRIYGFKVSERARSGPRMQWLRMRPRVEGELDWKDDDVVAGGGAEGEKEEGAFDDGKDDDDDDDEEEEEEEEEEEDDKAPMKMSSIVGTTLSTLPSPALPSTAAADDRGRPRADSTTLMNSRIYRPLPASRSPIPPPAAATVVPVLASGRREGVPLLEMPAMAHFGQGGMGKMAVA